MIECAPCGRQCTPLDNDEAADAEDGVFKGEPTGPSPPKPPTFQGPPTGRPTFPEWAGVDYSELNEELNGDT